MLEGTLTMLAILGFFFLVAAVFEFVFTRAGYKWALFAVVCMFLGVSIAADISKDLHQKKTTEICEVNDG